MLRIFFATDVHGSDLCWKKFIAGAKFYDANVLVLGGDMTGKAIIPMVETGGGRYRVELMDQVMNLKDEDDATAMEKTIANKGYYPVRMAQDQMDEFQEHPDQVSELFNRCVLERVQTWLDYADDKLEGTGVQVYCCPGNDDVFEVDEIVKGHPTVTLAEGRVIDLDDNVSMISTGWANRTPWKTHREMDERDLGEKIEAMAIQVRDPDSCIFNLHCPAHGSGLDQAPELDANMRPKYAGHVLASVGSTAVRESIERHRPVLALFGHIHEGRGVTKIGPTVCINPGSTYESGILLGAQIDFDGRKIVNHTLTSG